MAKWIKVERPWHGLNIHIILFNKIDLFAGKADSWGISLEYNPYEPGIVAKIFNLYIGFMIYFKALDNNDD